MLNEKVIARCFVEAVKGSNLDLFKVLGGALAQGFLNICPICGAVMLSHPIQNETQVVVKCHCCHQKVVIKVGKYRNVIGFTRKGR